LETFKFQQKKAINFRGTKAMSKKSNGLVYECVKCGAKVSSEELELRGGRVKCTFCGYRVLKKIRPPVVKRVPAK